MVCVRCVCACRECGCVLCVIMVWCVCVVSVFRVCVRCVCMVWCVCVEWCVCCGNVFMCVWSVWGVCVWVVCGVCVWCVLACGVCVVCV